ncbi:molybdate ABC transporter substrate-binding protein [Shinella kummerowiae]|uniref:molybdate ABC transporter substrate-binding protein n=1 Tax=Shinella kummerowiae TaxID=417745 RepID=UPI0021B5FF41|nr:molybdate ABC transporter substrate-binding protein [Shinella kummerowiae]
MRDVVRVLSAGSLRHAMPEITAAFEEGTGIAVSLELGPAGLLRERIEAGEPFDLFASANMAHPERLVSLGLAREATCFARNRLAIIARADLGLTAETIADVLSKPSIRIGTSTPGDDPSGDYAFAMFDRLDAGHPGLGKGLKARALQLVGGRHSSPGRSATSLIADGTVDLFLSYASNARLHESDPRFSVTQLPAYLSPEIAYGVALGRASGSIAKELHAFLLTDRAQILLVKNGFLPKAGEAVESGR